MRRVKSNLAIVSSVLIIWAIPSISIAEQRMITFEMGESGQTVSFPMTQKELLEAEKVDKVIEKIKQRKRENIRMVESYELAESGITIDFPMSDEEIKEENSKYQELVIHHEKMSELQEEMEKRFEIFEFSESGTRIRFEK